jgi:hypothetical protein
MTDNYSEESASVGSASFRRLSQFRKNSGSNVAPTLKIRPWLPFKIFGVNKAIFDLHYCIPEY